MGQGRSKRSLRKCRDERVDITEDSYSFNSAKNFWGREISDFKSEIFFSLLFV